MSLLLNSTKIINEWTDYNNHMNLSFYILVFDKAAEKILSQFKMGEEAAKNLGFKKCELMATQSGILLYETQGYEPIEEVLYKAKSGKTVPMVRMEKDI